MGQGGSAGRASDRKPGAILKQVRFPNIWQGIFFHPESTFNADSLMVFVLPQPHVLSRALTSVQRLKKSQTLEAILLLFAHTKILHAGRNS